MKLPKLNDLSSYEILSLYVIGMFFVGALLCMFFIVKDIITQ